MRIHLFNDPYVRLDTEAIKIGRIFTLSPFVGKFLIKFENLEILTNRSTNKTLFPFRYIIWLTENFSTYFKEGIENAESEIWRSRHFLQYGLGDFSPDIAFYRSEDKEIVEDSINRKRYYVKPKNLAYSIYEVTSDALDILSKNPQLRDHEITRKLKDKNNNNLRSIASL